MLKLIAERNVINFLHEQINPFFGGARVYNASIAIVELSVYQQTGRVKLTHLRYYVPDPDLTSVQIEVDKSTQTFRFN